MEHQPAELVEEVEELINPENKELRVLVEEMVEEMVLQLQELLTQVVVGVEEEIHSLHP
jgi:hypothetical protein